MTNVVAYRGHQNPVWDVDWSPMGIYFATASRDRTARLWSTDRTTALRIYAGHLSDVDVGRCSFLFPITDELTYMNFVNSTVCQVPSELALSCDGVKRLDGTTLGRPERLMCASVRRSSRRSNIHGVQSRRSIPRHCRFGPSSSHPHRNLEYSRCCTLGVQLRTSLSTSGTSVPAGASRK